jgi:hypothetical protein
MGIGTLRIEDLEYGESHLTDGARRPRLLHCAVITANGAHTKAAFKRLITRRDRHEWTVELAQVELITDTEPEAVAADDELADFDEWLDAMNDEHPLIDQDEAHAQMLQAYEDDGVAWDTPTSAVYGTGFDYEALLDGFHVTARGGRRLLALVD